MAANFGCRPLRGIGTELRARLGAAPCSHAARVGIELTHYQKVQLAVSRLQNTNEDLVKELKELAAQSEALNSTGAEAGVLRHAGAKIHAGPLAVLCQQGADFWLCPLQALQ